MKRHILFILGSVLTLVLVAGCSGGGGGGGGSPPMTPVTPTIHTVTLSWAPNHETGVNSAGGGYQVSISGQPTINVPFTSGLTAPTSTTVSLITGTYTVTVRAYAALDALGGSNVSFSAASQPITVNVP